jgi:hypothetical protein
MTKHWERQEIFMIQSLHGDSRRTGFMDLKRISAKPKTISGAA